MYLTRNDTKTLCAKKKNFTSAYYGIYEVLYFGSGSFYFALLFIGQEKKTTRERIACIIRAVLASPPR